MWQSYTHCAVCIYCQMTFCAVAKNHFRKVKVDSEIAVTHSSETEKNSCLSADSMKCLFFRLRHTRRC